MTADTNLAAHTFTRTLTGDQAAALHEHFFYTLDSDAFPMPPLVFDAFMAATGTAVPPSEDVLKGALEAALWTGLRWNHESQETESDDLRRPMAEVPEHIVTALREDVQMFLRDQAHEIVKAMPLYAAHLAQADWTVGEQIGHDFTLTRNHEGAGFWDRGLGEVGDLLTAACRPFGTWQIEADDEGDLWTTG